MKSFNKNINYNVVTNYPSQISLCYDYTCTAKCVFCNDEIKKMSAEESNKWKEVERTKLLPLLKNAKFIRLNMTGELFVSEHSKSFVKNIAEKYSRTRY